MNIVIAAELTLAAGRGRDGAGFRTTAWQRDASAENCPLIGQQWSMRKFIDTAREIQRTGAREARLVPNQITVTIVTVLQQLQH